MDYAVVSADNVMKKSVGPASNFIFGHLLHVVIDGVTNGILPPAFRKDTNSSSFDWVSCPKQGPIWAKIYQMTRLRTSLTMWR